MSKKTLKNLRARAFSLQAGRCYYCGLAMWQSSPNELGLRARAAAQFRCTAEHLVAKQEGGRDAADNIVAAHATCNHRRHNRRGPAPSPDVYRGWIERRMAAGKWWSHLPAALKPLQNRMQET